MWIFFIRCFTFQGRVGGNSTLVWKGSVTHPTVTAFTHPNAGVFARVLRQQATGKHNPVRAVQCLLPCGDAKTRFAYQGQNIRPADFAPTLLQTRPRKKGGSPASALFVHVIISFVGLEFFTCVQVTAVLSGNVWFTFPFASAFSYPAYEYFKYDVYDMV